MKKNIIVLSLIIAVVISITLTQIPGIYAVPTEYSDFNEIVISADDHFHNNELSGQVLVFMSKDAILQNGGLFDFHNNYGRNFISGFVGYLANQYCVINDQDNNPYPDIPIPEKTLVGEPPFSQRMGYQEVDFWNYIFSISKYWKVYATNADYYGSLTLFLKPYDYIEPTFNIECNPSQISKGETSKCVLKTNYHSKIESLNFKLDTSLYNISDIKPGEEFENLQANDGVYSLTSKNTLEDSPEGRTVEIISFYVSSNNDNIASSDNIKVLDLKYVDELVESPTRVLAATVNQKNKNNIIDLKNPKTKNNFIIVGILLSAILLSIIISIIKNKKHIKE